MPSLPTVGGDSGTWGAILNSFLQVVHDTDGTLKPVTIDTAPSSTGAGDSNGLRVIVGTAVTNRPAANDYVPIYTEIDSSASRQRIWGANTVAWVKTGANAYAWGLEVNVNNDSTDVAAPGSANHKIGIESVSGNSTNPGSAAFAVNTARTGGNGWHHGLYIRGVSDSAITITDVSSGGTLFPTRGITIGNPSLVGGNIVAKQFADGGNGLVLQRFTDTTPTGLPLQVLNAANSVVLAHIDALGTIRSTAGVGTKHEAAATPTGGLSGDIRVGNGKVWVNDAGTWKSAAVA